jgi:hypothetical protein
MWPAQIHTRSCSGPSKAYEGFHTPPPTYELKVVSILIEGLADSLLKRAALEYLSRRDTMEHGLSIQTLAYQPFVCILIDRQRANSSDAPAILMETTGGPLS